MPTATRRAFLGSLARLGLAWPVARLAGCAGEPAAAEGLVLSAHDGADGLHYVSGFDLAGGVTFTLPLAARGHAAAVHPERAELVVCARRPGDVLTVVDLASGQLVAEVRSPAGHHYLGHAIFDPGGARLYATENRFDDAEVPDLSPRDAVVGVYDAGDGYRRLGEIAAHGVGAHQLAWLDDGALAIAVGGIYTHPASPRDALNLDTMDPAMVIVDPVTGALRARQRPADPLLSVRHFDVAGDGTIACGMQYQGAPSTPVALVALQAPGGALDAVEDPGGDFAAFDHYVGSVVVHRGRGRVAASSPAGGAVGFWDVATGSFAGLLEAADVCGLAAVDDAFVASTGAGELLVIDADDLGVRQRLRTPGIRWDNHMSLLR